MTPFLRLSGYLLGFLLAVVGALLLLFLPSVALAQEAVPLPVEDAIKVRTFGELLPARFSPDGKWFAYTVQDHQRKRSYTLQSILETGVPPWGIGGDIFVLDVASGKSRNITEGIGDSWLPAWSPDGYKLAFLSDREGNRAALWIWDTVRNELQRVSDAKLYADLVEWTPDSRKIVVTAFPERALDERQVRKEERPTDQQNSTRSKPAGSTVVLYGSDDTSSADTKGTSSDPWDLDIVRRDLILVNVSDGSFKRLVQGGRISYFQISPDGSEVAYTIPKRFEKAGSQQILFDLAVIPLGAGAGRVLATGIRLDHNGDPFSWSPDSSQLAFRNGGMEERRFDCHIVRADGSDLQNVTAFPASKRPATYRPGIPFWGRKGTKVYFLQDGVLWRASVGGSTAQKVAEISGRKIVRVIHRLGNRLWTTPQGEAIVVTHDDLGKQDGFYKVDLEQGTSYRLMEKGQCYTCVHIHEWQYGDATEDGRSIAFYMEDAQHSPDLLISDPSFQTVRRLSHLNPQYDKVAMGAARLIEWRDADGQSLKGALLLPSNYVEGKRYPLIVWVYGGVHLSDQFNHFALGYEGPFNMQLFATRGYAILMPDAPQRTGTPMADLARTVLPGVGKVIEMGIADPRRVGVMGHSYGGFSVLSLIVQTKRFKVAIALDGYGDQIGAYGQMGKDGSTYGIGIAEGGQGLMGGTPWQYRDRYIENSPIFYLDRVETPLLIVHGAEDTAVASFLSDELFVGLRRLGKEVQYAKYESEGHSPAYWSYANQVDVTNRMIAWFDDHLKKPEDKAAEKPKPN